MSVTNHVTALEKKHSRLETELKAENSRPLPDRGAIGNLKRQKLAIKDEIAQLAVS